MDVGHHHPRARLQLAHVRLCPLQVVVAPPGEGVREVGVADDLGLVLREGGGAQDVVRVDMRQNHIGNRLVRHLADGGPQGQPLFQRPAGVDHGHPLGPDHEPQIGDMAAVGGGCDLLGAAVEIDARGDLLDRECVAPGETPGGEQGPEERDRDETGAGRAPGLGQGSILRVWTDAGPMACILLNGVGRAATAGPKTGHGALPNPPAP